MRSLCVFIASGLVTFGLAFTQPVEAGKIRTFAGDCMVDGDDQWVNNNTYKQAGSGGVWGVVNRSASDYLSVYCAVVDHDATGEPMKEDYTDLDVHGFDGTSSDEVAAQTCVTYFDSAGGACGTEDSTSTTFTGNYTLSPAMTYWTATYEEDYGYIYVYLPKPGSGEEESRFSTFRGWLLGY